MIGGTNGGAGNSKEKGREGRLKIECTATEEGKIQGLFALEGGGGDA